MLSDNVVKECEKKMEQVVSFLKRDLQSVRVGRANPSMLDSVIVETPYGSTMRIKELANINSPDPRQLLLHPFDKQMQGSIAKAIEKADLGLKVSNEGGSIRLTAPLIDESIRKEAIKTCKKKAENGRVSIRTVRKEANSSIKNSELPEDTIRRLEKEIQKLTDKFCGQIDNILSDFEKDLLQV